MGTWAPRPAPLRYQLQTPQLHLLALVLLHPSLARCTLWLQTLLTLYMMCSTTMQFVSLRPCNMQEPCAPSRVCRCWRVRGAASPQGLLRFQIHVGADSCQSSAHQLARSSSMVQIAKPARGRRCRHSWPTQMMLLTLKSAPSPVRWAVSRAWQRSWRGVQGDGASTRHGGCAAGGCSDGNECWCAEDEEATQEHVQELRPHACTSYLHSRARFGRCFPEPLAPFPCLVVLMLWRLPQWWVCSRGCIGFCQ